MKRRQLLAAMPLVAVSSSRAATTLGVGAALPDPPFEFMRTLRAAGFDIELTQHIANQLGRVWRLIPYGGADFNGIFGGLKTGEYDCVASGTTITPDRERLVDFCNPYVVSGQSLVVDTKRHPNVHGINDLKGLVLGVQDGNTSQPVANKLAAEGRVGRVRVYAYDQIETALNDLQTGGCDAFMKLGPVMEWLIRSRPDLRIVETGITHERLAICVRKGDTALRSAINGIQAEMIRGGRLQDMIKKWLGNTASLP